MPPPWWRRLLINLGIPVLTLVIGNSIVGGRYGSYAFWTVLLLLWARGWYYRHQERQEIMRLMYTRTQQQGNVDAYLKQNRCNTLMATAVCGCVKSDDSHGHTTNPDCCTRLWQCLSSLCCGMACKCWCQWCGMCAVAQQDYQLEQEESIQVDYITFEPFQEYAVKLEELRTNQVKSFWQHATNMSKLSYKLLQMLAWSLVVLAIVAVLQVERNFTLVNLLVVRIICECVSTVCLHI